MYLERKEDLSIYYWLVDLFSTSPHVTIRDGFPTNDLVIPSVAVEAQEINIFPGELGNKSGIVDRVWYIDVFATNKSQRDEFAYYILHALEESIPVYNYDMGFPPDISPTQIGCLIPDDLKMEIIRIMPELVDKLYYRSAISFTTKYNQL